MSKLTYPCSLDDIEAVADRTIYYAVDENGDLLEELDSTDDDLTGYRCHRCYEDFDSWDEVPPHLDPPTVREEV